VNLSLPPYEIAPNPLLQSPDPSIESIIQLRRTRLTMTSPERPPMSGLVQISVAYDESKPRGVSVEISGAMGVDLEGEKLAEIVRRGGALGLAGRVWSKSLRG
jgi:hypothetical protein